MNETIIETPSPVCRFGDCGLYRDSESNYFREFKDGLRAVQSVAS